MVDGNSKYIKETEVHSPFYLKMLVLYLSKLHGMDWKSTVVALYVFGCMTVCVCVFYLTTPTQIEAPQG